MKKDEMLKEKENLEKELKESYKLVGTARKQLNDVLSKQQKLRGKLELMNSILTKEDNSEENLKEDK